MTIYQPQQYWEKRLANRLDITTVGHKGLGYIYNSWLYQARVRALNRAIYRAGIDCIDKSVIELGVGSGIWIPFWQQHGVAAFAGVDITAASVTTLAQRYPQYHFVQSNVGAESSFYADVTFDLVTAFDVFFHITDDHQFSTAIANLARLVKPKGFVLISDGFCEHSVGPHFHQHFRSQEFYLQEMSKVGLKPIQWEPIFFLMTDTPYAPSDYLWFAPIALRHYFVDFTHRVVRKLAARKQTEWSNHLIGSLLYIIDGVLGSSTKMGAALKLLIAQKE